MDKESIPKQYREALDRLIEAALGVTGQSKKVADFLLAWWNGEECGGFDLGDLFSVDRSLAVDMVTVCRMLVDLHHYPDTLGYGPEFVALVERWRPVAKA